MTIKIHLLAILSNCSRLLKSVVFILLIFVISYTFAEYIYNFLVEPYANAVKNDQSKKINFYCSTWNFYNLFKSSFFSAIFIGSPILIIQIYKFTLWIISKWKRAILPYLIFTPIFLLEAYYLFSNAISYKIFIFETAGSTTSLPIQLEAKVNEYLSLIMRLIFAFGISFQLPFCSIYWQELGS